jgi:hypothetical protein
MLIKKGVIPKVALAPIQQPTRIMPTSNNQMSYIKPIEGLVEPEKTKKKKEKFVIPDNQEGIISEIIDKCPNNSDVRKALIAYVAISSRQEI